MKKEYIIKIITENGPYTIKFFSETLGDEFPLTFNSRDAAESYARSNGYNKYLIEEYN